MILLEFFKFSPTAWTWQEISASAPIAVICLLLAMGLSWSIDKVLPGTFSRRSMYTGQREITDAGLLLCMAMGFIMGAAGHVATVYFF